MVTPEFKANLLERIDIVSLISAHVELKPKGSNYLGLCPFHNEKTASFSVNSSRQFYYCFGCGAKGDAIQFLMDYFNFSFVDSLKELCQKAGVHFPEEQSFKNSTPDSKRQHKVRSNHKKLLLAAARFYRSRLASDSVAVSYLKKRGISGKVAAKFHIGYAGNSWNSLKEVFSDYEDSSDLFHVGLIKKSESGNKIFDRFRKRIIFPIFNKYGEVIAFGGRTIVDDKNVPKYLNSPETDLFVKSKELYGFFDAQRFIAKSQVVIVVEGYFDVISMHQGGFKNTVGTLGTALSSSHFLQLERISREIIFMFDGDAAGKRAAWRAAQIVLANLSKQDMLVSFIFLPQNKDPDTFIREKGNEALAKLLKSGIPLSTMILETVCSSDHLSSVEGKSSAIATLKNLFKSMSEGIFKRQLMQAAGQHLSCSISEFGDTSEIPKEHLEWKNHKVFFDKKSELVASPEIQMLKVLVRDPENLTSIFSEDREWFMKEYEAILTWIQENGGIGDNQNGGDNPSYEFEQDNRMSKDMIQVVKKVSQSDPVLDNILKNKGTLKKEFDFLFVTLKIEYLETKAKNLTTKPEVQISEIHEIRREILSLKNAQVR
ncbi:DNA primase [Betaproteobacteria bacterium]|nr:DNA primase [Betaproteobacteria bacterium]